MTIEEFIEKGIEGGWVNKKIGYPLKNIAIGLNNEIFYDNLNGNSAIIKLEEIVLDPKFWEAVGKVEGWSEALEYRSDDSMTIYSDEAEFKMHEMIGHFFTGGTIESFISKL